MENEAITLLFSLIGYVGGVIVVSAGLRLFVSSLSSFSRGAWWRIVAATFAALAALELTFGLWESYPGAAGLGSLHIIFPSFMAGIVAVVTLAVVRENGASPASKRPFWILLVANVVIAAALWRFWPEPTARLF